MLIEITEIQTCLVVYRIVADSLEDYKAGLFEYDKTIQEDGLDTQIESIEIIEP